MGDAARWIMWLYCLIIDLFGVAVWVFVHVRSPRLAYVSSFVLI